MQKSEVSFKRENIKKIAVVVPVFNEGQLIGKCIRSLLEQDFAQECYEIVVVDDGSTDKTVQVLKKFSREGKIKLVTFKKNQGRIVARKVGAEKANYENILFIDSRCIAGKNLLSEMFKKRYQPLIAGQIHGRGESQSNPCHRVIDLFRLKYYLADSSNRTYLINANNFKRSPKGTTCLLIHRDLFLRGIPQRTGRDVNDDIRILREVVKQKPILRCIDLSVRYLPREAPKQILEHLFHRGPRFADYYFSSGGPYRGLFFLVFFIFLGLLAVAFFYPFLFSIYFAFILLSHLGLSVFLAQNLKDFFLVFIYFPAIAIVFTAGIFFGKARRLFQKTN
jgi:glycosyltransferase involved in cell wall biosynthesis